MRRLPLAVVACLILVLAGTAVAAGLRSGRYRGQTGQGERLGLSVWRKDKQSTGFWIQRLRVEGVRLTCTDGDSYRVTVDSGKKARWRIRDGRFAFTVRRRDGSGFGMRGNVGEFRASGAFQVFSRFTTYDWPFARGPVKCSSGRISWSSARVGS